MDNELKWMKNKTGRPGFWPLWSHKQEKVVAVEMDMVRKINKPQEGPQILEVWGLVRLRMAPHSSTLAWKIPWTEEPGVLQSMGSLRVGHDWATSLSLFTFTHWKRKWQPTPVFLPGESQGQGAWWLPSMGSHSRTWLKRLSSSSSSKVKTGIPS